ncbi:MFS transporter [Paractinoplanes rishiriensis]|uniref:MFS transporter n=1 Tax=Paractinoplanes rishiriensis TaxID=1050105 RepID=A0A919JQ83_9ACTN|nr:MFS transporter [Actinoplanes rishiriensis]GIE92895.1 MFS transporter [Actinoplanes rishiriensis]
MGTDFWLLWSGRLVSQLGVWLLVVAVPAHVFVLTGSVAATGLTLTAQFVPPLLLGPVAGVCADRWDRRVVMVGAHVGRAGAVALLLLVREPGDIWLVYLALLAESIGTTVFRPAAQAHTPALVGVGKRLTSANALNGLADGMVRLVGAPLGGLLYAAAGLTLVAWLNIGAYLLATVAVGLTRRSSGAGRRASLRSGLVALRSLPLARTLMLVNGLFLGANAGLSALLVPYGISVLGGSRQTGVVMSALGVGFLLGAPLVRLLVDRVAAGRLLGGALTGTAVGYALLFSAGTLAAAVPAAVVIGVAGSTALGTANTTLQRTAPNEVLGRVSAALLSAEALATLVGAAAGPALAAQLSMTGSAVVAAGITVISGGVALRRLPSAA